MTKKAELGLSLVIMPFAALWWAFVATIMWGWFITPFGVDQIGKAHALGLAIFSWMFVYSLAWRETPSEPGELLARNLAGPIIVTLLLGFGWVAKELMK